MKNDHQPLDNSSRSQQRAKRRKTNIVLNSLIVVVLLLIVFVSFNIFFGKDEKASSTANGEKVESTIADKESDTESASAQKEDNDTEKADGNDREKTTAKTEDDKDTKINKKDDDKAKTEDDEKSQDEEDKDKENQEDEEIVTEGGNDPDVKTTIVNPAWEPVGTTQTGDHPSGVYSGVDWDEMVQAITYATGLDQSNMTILFLGNNGVNKSVGNIKQKDSGQEYRVYIEWVDGEGWKPTSVEEIH